MNTMCQIIAGIKKEIRCASYIKKALLCTGERHVKLPLLVISGCHHLEWHQILLRAKLHNCPLLIKKEMPNHCSWNYFSGQWTRRTKHIFLDDMGIVLAILYITFHSIISFVMFLQTIKDSPMWTTLIGLLCSFCGEFQGHIKMKEKWSQGGVLWPLKHYSTKAFHFLSLQLFPSSCEITSSLPPFGFRIMMALPFLVWTSASFLIFLPHSCPIFINSPFVKASLIVPTLG